MQREFTINIWSALGILGAAILVSVVGTAFAIGGTLNSDHFVLQSTAQAVTEIKSDYVRSDVYQANQTSLNGSLRDIKNQLTDLSSRIPPTPVK